MKIHDLVYLEVAARLRFGVVKALIHREDGTGTDRKAEIRIASNDPHSSGAVVTVPESSAHVCPEDSEARMVYLFALGTDDYRQAMLAQDTMRQGKDPDEIPF